MGLHGGVTFVEPLSISMKSHSHTTIDVSCGDIGRWHVKVFSDNAVECLIGVLVGVVGSSVSKSPTLLFADGVFKQGRIMPLHQQLVLVLLYDKLGFHPISSEKVL